MKTLADLTAPAAPTRKLLEKDVQKQCVDWARARGYWARKFSSMSQTSVPDYLFARKLQVGQPTETLAAYVAHIKFACEFKRPGSTPTEAQWKEIELMRAAGWEVFFADSFELFKSMVFEIERSAIA